ncbi:hypothetical protein [Mesorhizobium sophorae]|uniref:hypothetical protein n=1 Tax=Mesorhizobium sophorae TaxID=1300294 RepID=UPI000BA4D1EE|nr:hypothetical protein [Mesorhizobium sophorae]
MADRSGELTGAAFLIIIFLGALAPNNEQQIVQAMTSCKSIDAEATALERCMNYQGFRVAQPGEAGTEVTNYVAMYGWEHGWLKRTLNKLGHLF